MRIPLIPKSELSDRTLHTSGKSLRPVLDTDFWPIAQVLLLCTINHGTLPGPTQRKAGTY